jgi:hypothetical protein
VAALHTECANFSERFILGDFNLCSKWDEQKNIPSSWVDAWPFIYPSDPHKPTMGIEILVFLLRLDRLKLP